MFRVKLLLLGVLVLSGLSAPSYCEADSNLLSYRELLSKAVSNNPRVSAQSSMGEAAAGAERAAEWGYYPSPSVRGETDSDGERTLVLQLQQPIWTGGRLTANLDSAKAQRMEVESSILEVKQGISLEIVDAYASICMSSAEADSLGKYIEGLNELQALMQRRVKLGYSGYVDLRLVNGRLSQARASRARFLSDSLLALARLSELVNEPLKLSGLDLQIVNPSTDSSYLERTVQKWIDRVVVNSPSLKRVEAQIKSTRAGVDLAKSSMMPNVFTRYEYKVDTNNNNGEGRLVLGVEAALSGGLSGVSQVTAAKARLDAVNSQLSVEKNLVIREVVDLVNRWRAARDLYADLKDSQVNQEVIHDSYTRRFLAGKGSWLEVLNVLREKVDIESQITKAKIEAFRSIQKLLMYTGEAENEVI